MQPVGAHVSASGGYEKALERVVALGGDALQLFSASPRVWRKPGLESVDAALFAAERERLGVGPVFTHALYLVNLASDKPDQLHKSIAALKFEMAFDAAIVGDGVVVHLGSHQGRGWEAMREQIAAAIETITSATPSQSTFLIENSAGQNGKIASDLAEIRWLLDRLPSDRVGWCLDTCHAHAAGYELDPAGQRTRGSLLRAIDELELWDALKCVHVNDSRDAFDSGKDRHANLGEGQIKVADFQAFLTAPELQAYPLILEVPGEGSGPDQPNLDRLKSWIGS